VGFAIANVGHCQVEATTNVETSLARNGPKGTSAGYTEHSFDLSTAVTITLSGTCWTARSIYLSGEAGSSLSKRSKSIALKEDHFDAQIMQKRAKSARSITGLLPFRSLAAGLLLVGLTGVGFAIANVGHCQVEATTNVETSLARNGPKGTSAGCGELRRTGVR